MAPIFLVMGLLFSAQSFTEVLELGESSVSGKKDQPEAMTFVSRRPVDLTGEATNVPDLRLKIKQEISDPVFNLAL